MILISNALPMPIFDTETQVSVSKNVNTKEFCKLLSEVGFYSTWGHSNTLAAANALLGVDMTPKTERAAIAVRSSSSQCTYTVKQDEAVDCDRFFIVTPRYEGGFRPQLGTEVDPTDIVDWVIREVIATR